VTRESRDLRGVWPAGARPRGGCGLSYGLIAGGVARAEPLDLAVDARDDEPANPGHTLTLGQVLAAGVLVRRVAHAVVSLYSAHLYELLGVQVEHPFRPGAVSGY
jgi:hypothetical protein